MNKKCFKCGIVKPLEDFYKHQQMNDGRLNKCKSCTKSDVRAREAMIYNDPVLHEKEKERGREKYHRLNYREKYRPSYESKKKAIEKYHSLYPEKRKARAASNILVKKGFQVHHWSYCEKHFTDVFYLRLRDHTRLHRFLVYDKEERRYRTKSGLLLSSREEHEDYMNKVLVLNESV